MKKEEIQMLAEIGIKMSEMVQEKGTEILNCFSDRLKDTPEVIPVALAALAGSLLADCVMVSKAAGTWDEQCEHISLFFEDTFKVEAEIVSEGLKVRKVKADVEAHIRFIRTGEKK